MINGYGAVGEMRIGMEKQSTGRKPARVPLCQSQIPYDLSLDRTRAAAIGNWRLTAYRLSYVVAVLRD
jgi:hypothetical protein